jgi:A/G-specific adenine glycosylase
MDYGALHLTAQKTGIKPKTQQSRFKGSDRQIRAQILRGLLQKPQTFSELEKLVHIDRERLKPILEKMIKEHIIIQQGAIFQLHQ